MGLKTPKECGILGWREAFKPKTISQMDYIFSTGYLEEMLSLTQFIIRSRTNI